MAYTTLRAVAIATLVLTRAFEKRGEKLGEDVLEESHRLVRLLHNKFPSTAAAVELAQQQPRDYGQTVLEEMEAATKRDPEISQAVQDIETATKSDPRFTQAFQSLTKALKSQPSIVQSFGSH